MRHPSTGDARRAILPPMSDLTAILILATEFALLLGSVAAFAALMPAEESRS